MEVGHKRQMLCVVRVLWLRGESMTEEVTAHDCGKQEDGSCCHDGRGLNSDGEPSVTYVSMRECVMYVSPELGFSG